jgi:hypothetical protein
MKLPNGSQSLKNFENAYALINPRTHFLEIYRYKLLIAAFHPDSYLAWEYVVAPPPQPTRAEQLLHQHEK